MNHGYDRIYSQVICNVNDFMQKMLGVLAEIELYERNISHPNGSLLKCMSLTLDTIAVVPVMFCDVQSPCS